MKRSNGFVRALLAALAIAALMTPYAAPVACDAADHERSHATHSDNAPDRAVTAAGDGHASCHDAMGCVAHSTAVIARVAELRDAPAHVEAPPRLRGSAVARFASPLTPPPRA